MAERSEPVLDIPADDFTAGVGAELEYAGFWSRFAALIVDNAILTILGIALLMAAASVGDEAAVMIANLALFLIALLYWPLMECSERQATLGKQLLGIQVTDANGARLTFVRSLLRNLAKIISSLPFGLGFLLAAFTARRQALHDLITKCLVVRAGPSSFGKAIVATVLALLILIAGGYYYFTEVYMPQLAEGMGGQMGKGMKQVQKGAPAAKPAPVPPPLVKGPSPVPPPAPAAPDAPKPMTPQEIAEFEKKMADAKREPEKVAAAQPPAPAAATEQKPAAPAPAATAKPEAKPEATAKPKPEVKPAVVAAAEPKPKPKPEPKPEPKAAPKPEPKPAAEVPTPLVTEPTATARPAEPRAPAVPDVTVIAPLTGVVRTPKFNDVMTAVMYRDVPAAAELLELGWWVDRPDSNRVTPLMAAAWLGDFAMTQLLLKGGADPTLRSPSASMLDYANRGGDPKVVELLKRSGAR
ncbi:MAG TPA: RDD family protein [Burkholderiales bacterium]|nr:RDD family protein [Burkholderiales bacterium]